MVIRTSGPVTYTKPTGYILRHFYYPVLNKHILKFGPDYYIGCTVHIQHCSFTRRIDDGVCTLTGLANVVNTTCIAH